MVKKESQEQKKYEHGGNWDPEKMKQTVERFQKLFKKLRQNVTERN